MSSVIVWVFVALVVMFVLTKAFNSISKSTQKIQGHDKCQACGSRLKAVNGKYMPVCRKCGARQTQT